MRFQAYLTFGQFPQTHSAGDKCSWDSVCTGIELKMISMKYDSKYASKIDVIPHRHYFYQDTSPSINLLVHHEAICKIYGN